MRAYRLEIAVAAVVVGAALLSYLANPILPIFILTVVGIPTWLFLMSRDPHG
ncbi:MAG TPA: hypothetical protein VIL04_06505 [Solirubrobacterales bacterium]|jgi:hypothetical protein